MNNLFESFIATCSSEKSAFIIKKKKISFSSFLNDIYACKSLVASIPGKDPVLIISSTSSYVYYVSIYASLMEGRKVIIFDEEDTKGRLAKRLDTVACRNALVDPLFKKKTKLLPKSVNIIQIGKFKKYEKEPRLKAGASFIEFDEKDVPLLKPISYVFNQLDLIKDNVNIINDTYYSDLKMFSLMVPFMGKTLVLGSSLDKVKKNAPEGLLCSIATLLNQEKKINYVKNIYVGGNILYADQVEKILSSFPSSKAEYFYMLKDGTPLYKTDLSRYKMNPLTFDTPLKGVKVELDNLDKNRVGEVKVTTLIKNEEKSLLNGDLARLVGGQLSVVGKKDSSLSMKAFYNYELDQNIRLENKGLKEGFSFAYAGETIVRYKGKITSKEEGVTYKKIKNIPYSDKSNLSVNYDQIKLSK